MEYESLDRAILFAAQRHRGQRRDGEHPLPYLTHPIEALGNLRYVGQVTDPKMLVVAVLHDVLEESETTADEVEAHFGPEVRQLVVELTRREPTRSETAGMDKTEIRALRSAILLAEIAEMSPEAQTIKLADRLANLREAKRTRSLAKLERYYVQTREILKIIPKTVNPHLWREIQAELPTSKPKS